MRSKPIFLFLWMSCLCALQIVAGQGQENAATISADAEKLQQLESRFLIRVERIDPQDLSTLLQGGIPVVMEMQNCLFAEGNREHIRWLDEHGYSSTILHDSSQSSDYLVIGLRPDSDTDALQRLGPILHEEENWVIVRVERGTSYEELERARVFVTRMPHEKVLPPRENMSRAKQRYSSLLGGFGPANPLVQKIVNTIKTSDIDELWSDITSNPPTGNRYSSNQGCRDAATYCKNHYTNLKLPAVFQDWNASYAPNVVGTQEGVIYPDEVYIVEGHLDDLPSSGLAPGADDNASASVTVLEAAQTMNCWAFKSTVKYLNVTGEEQGLLGSNYYADAALAQGENIGGVINMDMNGWAGNGIPDPENLDLNYNSPSQWLGLLFAECATKYGTGLAVDAFLCPSLSASDHYPFWQNGYAAICGITDNEGYCGHSGNYPYYHQSSDTIANCGNPTFFYSTVKAAVATLAEMAEPFKITMTTDYFSCDSDVGLIVGDRDLNANPGAQETVSVEIWSDTETTPETVILTERTFDSMIFEGSIPSTSGPPAHGDGNLSVSPADTITARYRDALDCDGGTNITYTSVAHLDCIEPLISNVSHTNITENSATIDWTTDEGSNSVVHYGDTTPPANTTTKSETTTNHEVVLRDLQQCTVYYYSVESNDIAGNAATDNNAGQYYYFETFRYDPQSGLEPCHAGKIYLDKSMYSCSDTVGIRLVDTDLNTNKDVIETAVVTVTSSSESIPEQVILTENGVNSATFAGMILTDPGTPAADGKLQIKNSDMITVTYHDANDGAGKMVTMYITATADCTGPSITAIKVTDKPPFAVTVTWNTSEPSTSRIDYGTTTALGTTIENVTLKTSHSVDMIDFDQCQLGYFKVSGTDAQGNIRVDDRNGQLYTFETGRVGGSVFVDGFEEDNGWTLSGEWQIGTPQGRGGSGGGSPDPTSAYNSINVLGTDLTGLGSYPGDYEPKCIWEAVSPEIPSAKNLPNARLIIRRWLNVSTGMTDRAAIMGYKSGWNQIWQNANAVNDSSWALQTYDISSLVDNNNRFQIRFMITSNADTQESGWNIDNVIVKDGSKPDAEPCGGCTYKPSFAGLRSATDPDPCADTGISLSWQASVAWGSGSSGTYAIYRDTIPNFTPSSSNRLVAGLMTTSYTDAAAPNDSTLYYLVRAENNETCSSGPANSGVTDDNTVYIDARDSTSQTVPGDVGSTMLAKKNNDVHVRLSWNAIPNAASYRIYRADNPQMMGAVQIGSTTGLFFDDAGELLKPGDRYYKVKAASACGVEGP